MRFDTPPRTFDELRQRADSLRQEIVEHAEGLRWCWIPEYDAETGAYRLGVQYEGQCSWRKCGLLQRDCGRTANDWIRRLNEREGISVEAQREIQQSSDSSAKASLSDDETQVCILIRGAFVSWDVAPSTSEMVSQFGDLLQDPTAYVDGVPKWRRGGVLRRLKLLAHR